MGRISFNNLSEAFIDAASKYADKQFLSNDINLSFTYSEAKTKAILISEQLRDLGIGKNDKVAIIAENTPLWPIAYFAIMLADATAVPILPEFSAEDIAKLLNHSESKAVFASSKQALKIDTSSKLPLFVINECDIDLSRNQEKSTTKRSPEPIFLTDLASIIYTSGTTGTPKGVMLTHDNFLQNTEGCWAIQDVNSEDVFLSVLPLAHSYEFTIGLILPMVAGSSINYLTKPPSVSTLLPALATIRPTTMLTVPLIIEKIFKGGIKPKLQKSKVTAVIYSTMLGRKLLHYIAGKELKKKFGGRIRFFGVGGAKLDRETERFLSEAKFPYSIGYGMTEASPLLAGAPPSKTKIYSTGPTVLNQELQIVNPNPKTGIGEIWARGRNVMVGYYKQPELTSEIITSDGWLKTGDLGKINYNGYLYICGRLKNIILGSNGENIYPEDIEAILNKHELVIESLVYEFKGKIIAKVHLNYEQFEKQYNELKSAAQNLQREYEIKKEELLKDLKTYVNSKVGRASQLTAVKDQANPFEKTPTLKIKRYLYTSKK